MKVTLWIVENGNISLKEKAFATRKEAEEYSRRVKGQGPDGTIVKMVSRDMKPTQLAAALFNRDGAEQSNTIVYDCWNGRAV